MAGFCREDILMEDNDILVVHKHAGMAVQNARNVVAIVYAYEAAA